MTEAKNDRVTIPGLWEKKAARERITALTAYDFPTARMLDEAGIDILLVGDSLGMVVLGYENTLPVTMEEMLHHTKAVTRAVRRALVVGDMPYFSFHLTKEETVANASRFIKEAGAQAVKIEGASRKRLGIVEGLVEAEIPVMGHVGLTPQSIARLGRYRVQGVEAEAARRILADARNLEKAGAFAVVLESVPRELAKVITAELRVPTIGIGAGPHCDGQVLVFHDLVGYSTGYLPKFVKKYADLRAVIRRATTAYISDVRNGVFPGDAESYHMKPGPAAALRKHRRNRRA
jgi:3-methyl-2-oxobutanoate hydroxymethyltransferase